MKPKKTDIDTLLETGTFSRHDTKHTPGPWKTTGIIEDDNDNMGMERLVDSNHNLICYSEVENAALIAAAPEMLEALENAMLVLVSVSDLETGTSGPIYKAMRQIELAIEKAKGE